MWFPIVVGDLAMRPWKPRQGGRFSGQGNGPLAEA
jgi:hypothetical protein